MDVAGFSTYWANKIIDSFLRNQTAPSASSAYAELSVQDPTDAGTGGTTKTNRVAVTFSAASASATANSAGVTFTVATNGTYAYVSIWDTATTGGNMLFSAALASSRAAVIGDTLTFNTGDLTVTLD